MLQKCLPAPANVDYNLPGCSVKIVLTCQPLPILWLYCEKYLAERIISCISEHILYIYLTAGKKCPDDRVIHDLITRTMWLLENDVFENPSLSAQTHLIKKCTVLLLLTYSQGLLEKINEKNHWYIIILLVYHNLYCSVAIQAVLMHSMLFYCNMCCMIAIHAVLLPFCCNLRCFVATT